MHYSARVGVREVPSSDAGDLDILDRVRADCAIVADGARRVRIDRAALGRYAEDLSAQTLPPPAFDAEHHFRGDEAQTVLAVLCLDAVNFGSGWFPRLRKRPGMSGYFTVASSIKDWFEIAPPTATELSTVSAQRVAELFGQRGNAEVAELITRFTQALRELGSELDSYWAGDATRLVDTAEHRVGSLVDLLSRLPSFRDVARWRAPTGELVEINFWKRAQLTAVDLDLALAGSGRGRFDDLHRLTIFADNLVPHVLRCDGVLDYDAELAGMIETETPIVAGSAAEVEIRACAVHAVELLVAKLAGQASAAELDYVLWNRGQQERYRSRPRHRTHTTCY